MKTLFPKQVTAHDFFVDTLSEGKSTIDTSAVGTGKTVVASHMIKTLGCPVGVICPKSVIPSWERELAETGVTPLFVTNYERIRMGKGIHMSKRGKKLMHWHLPEDTVVLVDEIHKCKSPFTQNAQLVISLIQQGYRVHGMSATACENPTEMRSIGYMLGLHSLTKSIPATEDTPAKYGWHSWMLKNGCDQDHWGKWYLDDRSYLDLLKNQIYGVTGHRLTVADFPDSFRANRVFVDPINFAGAKKIAKAYNQLGITPEIIDHYLEAEDAGESDGVENSAWVLVNILRARQLAEAIKVPDLAEIADDLQLQGNSVVIFLNFRESIDALCESLNCPSIQGGQSAAERQQIIDDFQEDKIPILVINTAAGGTGLSLHDINGKRPRVSLISPAFSAKDYMQVLGRIHRNGAKSDAVQKVMVAAGSIEERVIKIITSKLNNLKRLHGK